MSESNQPPKVFISYSWEDDEHREWVRKFATRLRDDGIETVLDRWHAVPGDQLGDFMERAVRESDFVLCVCTPKYKDKSDQRGGGVGYEGDVMTGEVFVNRNQRKFIPVLRKDEWKNSAPSWLMGKYFIDLRGDLYSEQNYQDLLTTLRGQREVPPPIGNGSQKPVANVRPVFEFVNREIELSTLDPAKLEVSYWQCALVSAPTGYGKSRLMKRLLDQIHSSPVYNKKWSYRYVDLQECKNPEQMVMHIANGVAGEAVASQWDEREIKNNLCSYVFDKLSVPTDDGALQNILLIFDSIDFLPPAVVHWFAALLHDMVVGSYLNYENDDPSFHICIILSGADAETFWQKYLDWEAASERYRLKPPCRLLLSAFNELAIQDMVNRRAKREGITLSSTSIQDISHELQYLSGGHPRVVAEILDELADKKFRMYKEHLRDHRERLIRTYVSMVAINILRRFSDLEDQKNIKTICLFRLIDLNTLQKLRAENLVSSQVDIKLLGQLCDSKILNPPNAEKLFYHDDIIRRILYLDLAFGRGRDDAHVQCVHKCAKSLYREWIESSRHSLHYFFVEWLFHSLQITDLSIDDIISEWKSLLSLIQTNSLPLGDFKHAIEEKLKKDSEVRYLFRERFGSEDFSRLFGA